MLNFGNIMNLSKLVSYVDLSSLAQGLLLNASVIVLLGCIN